MITNLCKFSSDSILLVCMDVRVHTQRTNDFKGKYDYYMDINWSIGTCYKAGNYFLDRGYIRTSFVERCCLKPGVHNLICSSGSPGGWNGAVLEVQGHQYCHDFIGYNAMRRVNVQGIKLFKLRGGKR